MNQLLKFSNALLLKLTFIIFLLCGLSTHAQINLHSFSSYDNGKTSIKISKNGFNGFSMKYEAKTKVSESDTDIIAIPDGGYTLKVQFSSFNFMVSLSSKSL